MKTIDPAVVFVLLTLFLLLFLLLPPLLLRLDLVRGTTVVTTAEKDFPRNLMNVAMEKQRMKTTSETEEADEREERIDRRKDQKDRRLQEECRAQVPYILYKSTYISHCSPHTRKRKKELDIPPIHISSISPA